MRAFAFVGHSNTGKTRLIARLVQVLKRRGYSVAVVKHCSHGFSLTPEQKDSWRFIESGADSVSLVGPDRLAVLRNDTVKPPPSVIAVQYHGDAEFVLVEGGRSDENLEKIEVLRKGVQEKLDDSTDNLLAVVSDLEVDAGRPVFHPERVEEIADFLENHRREAGHRVHLDVDGAAVPIKGFVQDIFENVLMGIIRTLKGIHANPRRITVSLVGKQDRDSRD